MSLTEKSCCIPTHDRAKISAEKATEGNAIMMLSTNICRPITLTMVETSEVAMNKIRIVGIASISLFSVSA